VLHCKGFPQANYKALEQTAKGPQNLWACNAFSAYEKQYASLKRRVLCLNDQAPKHPAPGPLQ
jgi:hypothetical protein